MTTSAFFRRLPRNAVFALAGFALAAGLTRGAIAQEAMPGGANRELPAPASPEDRDRDSRIQALKSDALDLDRDLRLIEQQILFPVDTRFDIYLSLDAGKLFELESVQVKLDDHDLTAYLYSPNEVAALRRGGVQRLYLGNLAPGHHELVAFFTGRGPHERDYRRAVQWSFDKASQGRKVELRIQDIGARLQPDFTVKVWQ